jgi:hypothetical protein
MKSGQRISLHPELTAYVLKMQDEELLRIYHGHESFVCYGDSLGMLEIFRRNGDRRRTRRSVVIVQFICLKLEIKLK